MSTQYNRKARRGWKFHTTVAETNCPVRVNYARRRPAIRGIQPRAFREPIRQSQKPAPVSGSTKDSLTVKLCDAVIRRHETPAWCKRLGEFWKERPGRKS